MLALAALGLAASTTSSVVHYRLLTEPGYSSFCDVNTSVSCTQAYLSRYGSIMGVPVALGGVLFFAFVLVVAGVAGRQQSSARETAPAYVFALSTIALAFVLYLAYASFVVLKAFCILCAITYVAAIGLFIVSGGSVTFPMTMLPRRAVRDLRTLVTSPLPLVVALLFVGGAVTVLASFPREAESARASATQVVLEPLSDQQREEITKWWDVQPKVELPISNEGAKVLVVVFSDYQCPHCRTAHNAFAAVMAKYRSEPVKLVLKHFPLEPECNAAAPGGSHIAACEAAAAVVMARSTGNAEKLNDWLFDHQLELDGPTVKKAAREVGGISDFDARYVRALQEVKTDASLGQFLQVNSTPTIFINGRKVPLVAPTYYDALIALELQRTR
jgi:uncharacterized membrane protein/protein-disulfide isomerase